MYFPIVIVIIMIVFLFLLIMNNRNNINIISDDTQKYDDNVKNVIDGVNYNDKLLFDNQKYIHTVYEENNNFTNLENKTLDNSTTQFFNMMKNYDALTHLTK